MPRSPIAIAAALFVLAASPALAAAQQPGPGEVDAAAWAVLDTADDEILGSADAGERRPVASATKLMTALVAVRSLDPRREVELEGYQVGNPAESVAGFVRGDTVSVEDLLYALLMVSANDAAVELAQAAAGSVPAFVRMMNAEADRLGLADTRFTNPIGLDEPGNYSTAHDLALLAARLRSEPLLARIAGTERRILHSPAEQIELANTNPLLAGHRWVNGIKTGQTLGAGWVLIASGERDGVELIAVVLGSSSEQAREQSALQLLDWGFGQYERRVIAGRLAPVGRVEIAHADGDLPLLAARRLIVRVRGDAVIDTKIDVPDPIEGPIGRGKRVGKVAAVVDGKRVAAVPVVASRAVGAPSLSHTSTPLLIAALAAIAFLVIIAAVAGARARARG